MTMQILNADQAKGSKCCFEEWKRDTHGMGVCGAPAVAMFGKSPLCVEHVSHALASSGSLSLLGKAPQGEKRAPVVFSTKDAFMVACRKEADARAVREKEAVNG